MKTPIVDFVRDYAAKNMVRFHMPGHKGKGDGILSSVYPYDITELHLETIIKEDK